MQLDKIYHRTKVETAYKIVTSKNMWSKDGHKQANFHTEKFGGGNLCHNEITLVFRWHGKVQRTKATEWPAPPNILHWTPWAAAPDELWTLALFPGTNNNLTLIDICEIQTSDEYSTLTETEKYVLIEKIRSEILTGIPIQAPSLQHINNANKTPNKPPAWDVFKQHLRSNLNKASTFISTLRKP